MGGLSRLSKQQQKPVRVFFNWSTVSTVNEGGACDGESKERPELEARAELFIICSPESLLACQHFPNSECFLNVMSCKPAAI